MSNEQAIVEFLGTLPEEASTTVRIIEKNDYYTVYKENAIFLAKEYFKTTALLKSLDTGTSTVDYLHLSKANFLSVLKYLLFVRQYKIEIYQNKGTGKSQEWALGCKGSPGNLVQLEDILFSEDADSFPSSKGLAALKLQMEGSEVVIGVAYCDAMLREMKVCQINDNNDLTNLQSILMHLSPKECLVTKKMDPNIYKTLERVLKMHNILNTECKPSDFSSNDIVQDLNRLLKLEEGMNFKSSMQGEAEMKHALCGLAAIIRYLGLLSDDSNFGQFVLSTFHSNLFARIDIQAVKGLGIFPVSPDDSKSDCLIGLLNKCRTAQGERFLRQLVKQPLMDLAKLEERLNIVEAFVSNSELRRTLHENYLRRLPDLLMLSRKIQRKKATLQDLYKIYTALVHLPHLKESLSRHNGPHVSTLQVLTTEIEERIEDFVNFLEMIKTTIDLDAIQNGEYIVKPEYDNQLLELRSQMIKLQKSINSTLDDVAGNLGLLANKSLKLEYCKIVGYHFRLTRKDEKNLRNKKEYIVIDTKASGVRFQNSALKQMNEQYMNLLKNYEEIQKDIVSQIMEVAGSYHHPMKLLSETIANLDVAVAFACVAVSAPKPYIRPKLLEKGKCKIVLKQVRHPILELQNGMEYIPNDVEILKDKHVFYFITGPNMGGKSTYIRSIALCVLLAQIGSFVPCDEAEISIVDAILTRIGASDMPMKGISTFMAEMIEMKNILNCATSNSLLIIDEMGRGTSTYDGFGLSWSISSHIATKIKSPCLFATHFHELTDLSKIIPSVGNLYVEALSSENKIVFLYRVKPGVSDQSFGIHVAEMAHFPKEVIEKAKEKLQELEEDIPFENFLQIAEQAPNGKIIANTVRHLFSLNGQENLAENEEILPLETFTEILEQMVEETQKKGQNFVIC